MIYCNWIKDQLIILFHIPSPLRKPTGGMECMKKQALLEGGDSIHTQVIF